MFTMRAYQAPVSVTYPHVEGLGKLLDASRTSSQSTSSFYVESGYFNITGLVAFGYAVQNRFFECNNIQATFVKTHFDMTEASDRVGGVNFFFLDGYLPRLVLIGCRLPHPNMLNGRAMFELGTSLVGPGGAAYVTMIDCFAFDAATATHYSIPDCHMQLSTSHPEVTYTGSEYQWNPSFGHGENHTLVKGISGTATSARNYCKAITISDTSTAGTWTFATAELDTSYHVLVTPCGSSGTPAGGSNRVTAAVTKNTGSFVFNVEAAPGAGNSVTFICQLVRAA